MIFKAACVDLTKIVHNNVGIFTATWDAGEIAYISRCQGGLIEVSCSIIVLAFLYEEAFHSLTNQREKKVEQVLCL